MMKIRDKIKEFFKKRDGNMYFYCCLWCKLTLASTINNPPMFCPECYNYRTMRLKKKVKRVKNQ